MPSLRRLACVAFLVVASASPALAQTVPGVGGGGYDTQSLNTSTAAPRTMSSTSTWTTRVDIGAFAMAVSRWWVMPAGTWVQFEAVAPTVRARASRTAVRVR